MVNKQWKHLGFTIPLNFEDLFKVNYEPLLKRMKESFGEWPRITFFWPERLELLKILPQFLFFFQNVPVEIPGKFFETWQRELVSFVWQKGSHRINKQFLSRPEKLGGYGLPILENYYLAAQLQTIYTYMASPDLLGWIQIEESYVYPRSLKEIL